MRDYLCNEETGDLIIQNGDFLKGPSEYKHVAVIVKSPKGFSRMHPLVGVGAANYKNAPESKLPTLVREINVQLEASGFVAANVSVNQDKQIEINV